MLSALARNSAPPVSMADDRIANVPLPGSPHRPKRALAEPGRQWRGNCGITVIFGTAHPTAFRSTPHVSTSGGCPQEQGQKQLISTDRSDAALTGVATGQRHEQGESPAKRRRRTAERAGREARPISGRQSAENDRRPEDTVKDALETDRRADRAHRADKNPALSAGRAWISPRRKAPAPKARPTPMSGSRFRSLRPTQRAAPAVAQVEPVHDRPRRGGRLRQALDRTAQQDHHVSSSSDSGANRRISTFRYASDPRSE